MALYRKYRPATFAEVVGQEHVTDPLSTALDTGRISHAYLFSGPRGCGKTSSARILARSLNCVEGPTSTPCGVCSSCVALGPGGSGNLDVIELDAASHGGVDDTRELRDRAFYAPAESRYRVFIVDEAHMVTTAGFNALLKIVEEPPAHLIFVFATTEPEKVLPTIRSRTHHYPFRLLPPATMRGLLGKICEQEHVEVEESVYPLVIRAGGGSPRDSLSVLDQLLAGAGPEGVTYPRAVSLLGVTDVALIDDAVDALANSDGASLFGTIDRVVEAGHDPRRFATDLLERLRDLILLRAVPDATERNLVTGPGDVLARMHDQAHRIGPATLARHAELLHEGLGDMRGATAPRLLLEVVAARMLLPAASDAETATLQRLEALERRMAGGAMPQTAPAAGRPAPAADPAPASGPASSPAPSAPTGAPRRRGAEALAALRENRTGPTPPTPQQPQAATPPQAAAPQPQQANPASLVQSQGMAQPDRTTPHQAANAAPAPQPATPPANSGAAQRHSDAVPPPQQLASGVQTSPAAAPGKSAPTGPGTATQTDAAATPGASGADQAAGSHASAESAAQHGASSAPAAASAADAPPRTQVAAVRPPEMNAVRGPVADSAPQQSPGADAGTDMVAAQDISVSNAATDAAPQLNSTVDADDPNADVPLPGLVAEADLAAAAAAKEAAARAAETAAVQGGSADAADAALEDATLQVISAVSGGADAEQEGMFDLGEVDPAQPAPGADSAVVDAAVAAADEMVPAFAFSGQSGGPATASEVVAQLTADNQGDGGPAGIADDARPDHAAGVEDAAHAAEDSSAADTPTAAASATAEPAVAEPGVAETAVTETAVAEDVVAETISMSQSAASFESASFESAAVTEPAAGSESDVIAAPAAVAEPEMTGEPAAAAEPVASAGGTAGGDSSEDVLREIEAAWADIRAKVREFGAAVQALLSGASVSRLEGGTIVFAHQHAPLAQRLSQPANLDAVRSAVKAVLGREHDVKWEVGSGAAPAAPQASAGAAGRGPAAGAGAAPKKAAAKFSRPSQAKGATASAATTVAAPAAWGSPAGAPAGTGDGAAAGSTPGDAAHGASGFGGAAQGGSGVARGGSGGAAGGAGTAAAGAQARGASAGAAVRNTPPEDDIPLPDGPDYPDDPGPSDYSSVGYDGVPPATTDEEEREMLAAAAVPIPAEERRDPDDVALELLRSELGATPLEG